MLWSARIFRQADSRQHLRILASQRCFASLQDASCASVEQQHIDQQHHGQHTVTEPYDVAILGGGMVGVTFAALLGTHPLTQGLRVAVVDRQELKGQQSDLSATPDMRVSTITPASALALKRIGAWSLLMPPTSAAFSSMQVWDAAGQAYIRYEADDIGADTIGHVVENNRIVAAVVAQLQNGATQSSTSSKHAARARGGVSLLAPKSLSRLQLPSGADPRHIASLATLELEDGSAISARLVVGADGARSRVREAAGLRTVGWQYGRRGLVATVATLTPNVTAWQRFLPAGPLALLPVRDGYSNIVWSTTPSEAKELEGLDPEQFAAAVNTALGQGRPPPILPPLLQAVTPWLPGSGSATPFETPPLVTGWQGSPPRSFPLQLSHAGRYVRPRVALIGDAAHAVHPLAGQGVNLGIADALALADAIATAVESGSDIGSEAFLAEAYEAPRQRANLTMMAALESLNHVFGPQSGAAATVRSAGLAMLHASGPLKQQIMRYAMG